MKVDKKMKEREWKEKKEERERDRSSEHNICNL